MLKKIQRATASSPEGTRGLVRGVLACAAQNIAFMLPTSLLYALVRDLMAGGAAGRTAFYVCGCVACFALILLTTWFQYNGTYFTTYQESGIRRLTLAERLRRLPLSFFGKRDLADLTSTIMSDCEVLEKTCSHFIPGLFGSLISTVLISLGMFFFEPRMALAALWVGGQAVWRMRALAAVLIAGFLTQYYFVVLACMLCGAYFFARLARREFAAAGRFALWCFFALALAVGLFPWCLNHIFGGYRGRGAMESAAALRLSDMCRWFKILWQTLDAQQFGGLLLALVCVGAALAFWPLKKAGQGLLRGAGLSAAALLACAAYVLVIAVVSPYKVDRYIFCVYPLATVALFMLFARGGCRFGSRRGSACLLACAVLAACGARVNREQQVHYLYPGDSAYLAACEENAALPCVVLGTNDMTQNTLELAAFDRIFLLDADDAQGGAPALEALGEEPDGFILFERYHDEANIETVLRTTGLERAERLFEHQYQVYWVH